MASAAGLRVLLRVRLELLGGVDRAPDPPRGGGGDPAGQQQQADAPHHSGATDTRWRFLYPAPLCEQEIKDGNSEAEKEWPDLNKYWVSIPCNTFTNFVSYLSYSIQQNVSC